MTWRALVGGLLLLASLHGQAASVTVGSKNFGESYLLAEIISQLLEVAGHDVERRFGMGGTLICYEALVTEEIDIYVEYTGTIAQAILNAEPGMARADIAVALDDLDLRMLDPLGFDNTYAVAVLGDFAEQRDLDTISDIAALSDVRIAFSHEFLEREDGWLGLREAYDFAAEAAGIQHSLAYRAIANDRIDATDAYSTDGDLERFELVILEDDRQFFPRYLAVPLVHDGLPPAIAAIVNQLGGRIDEARMRAMNATVVNDQRSFADVARDFLIEEGLLETGDTASRSAWRTLLPQLLDNTARHLQLTGVALGLACLIGLPLAIAVHNSPRLSRVVLYVAGLLQTIPSIALLALMIPILGIGWLPAVVSLFLYSLLPILRSTVTAMLTTDPILRRVAEGMGLTHWQQIRFLTLPLALPNVLAGVRTAAVISIGTATLAAFIGAGGLGDPIVTGLALNDPKLILQGAVPAAVLAVFTELLFEGIERRLVPAHLASDPLRT